ncbi:MAG: hypothetical protein KDD42_06070 [Bdellovibrionales bacterium]|nr:hypothetical protein [Bdellovibrionales bacterium]
MSNRNLSENIWLAVKVFAVLFLVRVVFLFAGYDQYVPIFDDFYGLLISLLEAFAEGGQSVPLLQRLH